jgi:hypothetical protein
MADFCKQCSEDMFGSDCGDLEGLCDEAHVAHVLCEGCGFECVVNYEGLCLSETCLKKHGLPTQEQIDAGPHAGLGTTPDDYAHSPGCATHAGPKGRYACTCRSTC